MAESKRGKRKVPAKSQPAPVSKDVKQAQQQRTTQLATRVREDLHMAMKLHVVKTGGTIMDFVESAVLRELARVGAGAPKAA